MVRKIIFSSFIVFMISWLLGAYYIKNKLTNHLAHYSNNNIELSYDKASIGGFPFLWRIKLEKPNFSIFKNNIHREASADSLCFDFSFNLQSLQIQVPESINYEISRPRNEEEAPIRYSVRIAHKHSIDIGFFEPLYKTAVWDEQIFRNINLFAFKTPMVEISLDNKALYMINDYEIKWSGDQVDNLELYELLVSGNYNSESDYLGANQAQLLLSMNYTIDNASKKDDIKEFDHKIDINRLLFKIDEAELDSSGAINLYRKELPSGKLNIAMKKYYEVINYLIPEGAPISRPYIKKIIAKTAINDLNKVSSNNDNIKFDLIFSNQGIFLGTVNLLELN